MDQTPQNTPPQGNCFIVLNNGTRVVVLELPPPVIQILMREAQHIMDFPLQVQAPGPAVAAAAAAAAAAATATTTAVQPVLPKAAFPKAAFPKAAFPKAALPKAALPKTSPASQKAIRFPSDDALKGWATKHSILEKAVNILSKLVSENVRSTITRDSLLVVFLIRQIYAESFKKSQKDSGSDNHVLPDRPVPPPHAKLIVEKGVAIEYPTPKQLKTWGDALGLTSIAEHYVRSMYPPEQQQTGVIQDHTIFVLRQCYAYVRSMYPPEQQQTGVIQKNDRASDALEPPAKRVKIPETPQTPQTSNIRTPQTLKVRILGPRDKSPTRRSSSRPVQPAQTAQPSAPRSGPRTKNVQPRSTPK